MLAVVVVLSLVVWSACYFAGSPLNAAETVVVVGLCALLAWLAGAAWGRLHKVKDGAAKPARPARKRKK
ncbi:hypothetical protein SAMN05444747_10314 [Variovorax sp. OV329]|nr:hypothetical protein SAMN05444747_10314 [Variovorax sp. OV329]